MVVAECLKALELAVRSCDEWIWLGLSELDSFASGQAFQWVRHHQPSRRIMSHSAPPISTHTRAGRDCFFCIGDGDLGTGPRSLKSIRSSLLTSSKVSRAWISCWIWDNALNRMPQNILLCTLLSSPFSLLNSLKLSSKAEIMPMYLSRDLTFNVCHKSKLRLKYQ